MRLLMTVLALFGAACSAWSAVTEPGAKLLKLAGGFAFTEGPACDRQGNVYFTDQPKDRIHKWSVDGKLSTFLEPCGRSNGLCFDARGNLWACADEQNQVWRIDTKGAHVVVVKDLDGRLLNGPNDLWVTPKGGVYLTDPYYRRDYWKRDQKPLETQGVYFLPPKGGKLVSVATDLKQANGIIGTPDGRTLYVADIGAGATYAYTPRPDGTLSGKRLFCKMGSDGMTLDSEGNVYLTGRGVTVFNSAGEQVDHLDVPESWTSNACFGGKDRRTLFITAGGSLYSVRTRVRGVGSQ
ncbi:MAG TPA: SMP-30/gluconolactonase/LRE family protein [Armatimonadota bacterium]|jgi:gluconolactonase